MEYQKIINLLDQKTNQPSKFRRRCWVEINYQSKGKHDNSKIRFKASITRPSFYDYYDGYILVKGTIAVPKAASEAVNTNNKLIFKITDCITKMDHVKNNQDKQEMVAQIIWK